jgi:hypothetical protein
MARSGEQIDNPIAGLSLLFVKTAADTGADRPLAGPPGLNRSALCATG